MLPLHAQRFIQILPKRCDLRLQFYHFDVDLFRTLEELMMFKIFYGYGGECI